VLGGTNVSGHPLSHMGSPEHLPLIGLGFESLGLVGVSARPKGECSGTNVSGYPLSGKGSPEHLPLRLGLRL